MIKSSTFATLRKQRGQSLVEMGLTLIFLLWILAAAVNFGLGWLSYVTLRDAAEEGAAYGSLNPNDLEKIEDHVVSSVRYGSGGSSPTMLVNPDTMGIDVSTPDGICPGQILKVTTTYQFHMAIPFIDMMIGDTIPLSAHATSEILKRVDLSCPPF